MATYAKVGLILDTRRFHSLSKVCEIVSNIVPQSVFEIIAGSTCCAEGLFELDLEERFHFESIGQFIDA